MAVVPLRLVASRCALACLRRLCFALWVYDDFSVQSEGLPQVFGRLQRQVVSVPSWKTLFEL